jgi:hypothetical protein
VHLGGALGLEAGFGRKVRGLKVTSDDLPDYVERVDLRPSEQGHGAWECAACNRAFQLKFLGLLSRGVQRNDGGGDEI